MHPSRLVEISEPPPADRTRDDLDPIERLRLALVELDEIAERTAEDREQRRVNLPVRLIPEHYPVVVLPPPPPKRRRGRPRK